MGCPVHMYPPPLPFPAVTGIFRFALFYTQSWSLHYEAPISDTFVKYEVGFLFMQVGYILPGQPHFQATPTSDFNPLVVQLRTDETTAFEVFHVVGPLSSVDTTGVSGVLFFHVSI